MSAAVFHRYVALGDSTTEGLEDPYPEGGYRGWADRLAERLAAVNPDLLYANLAVRGRKIGQIRAEQLPRALELQPDLASVVGGINDVLRPRADVRALAGDLEAVVAALAGEGATVLVMTYPNVGEIMAVARSVTARLLDYNERVRRIAARQGALVIDIEAGGPPDARLFHPDRLHANALGHERIALAAAAALGLPGVEDEDWLDPLPPLPPLPPATRREALRADAAWARAHFAPWLGRRLRGVSSGDGIEPKRPELAPVPPGH